MISKSSRFGVGSLICGRAFRGPQLEIPPKQTPFHRVKLTPYFRVKLTPYFRVKLTPVLAT
jgi:hypothetical protein